MYSMYRWNSVAVFCSFCTQSPPFSISYIIAISCTVTKSLSALTLCCCFSLWRSSLQFMLVILRARLSLLFMTFYWFDAWQKPCFSPAKVWHCFLKFVIYSVSCKFFCRKSSASFLNHSMFVSNLTTSLSLRIKNSLSVNIRLYLASSFWTFRIWPL